jgi:glycosyltransferase involved in cell wall biosynthesis
MKIIYLVNNSIPIKTCGYTIRTHQFLKQLKDHVNIVCVNKLSNNKVYKRIKDGVEYYNLSSPMTTKLYKNKMISKNNIYTEQYVSEYKIQLYKFALKYKPNVIHSCSNYINGLVGYKVAQKLNIRHIYEVRGFWELSIISRDHNWEHTPYFRQYLDLEKQVYDNSEIITLNPMMLNHIKTQSQLITSTIVPNCIDLNKFKFTPPIKKSNVTFGYIGSVVDYEGIDMLINVFGKNKLKLVIISNNTHNLQSKSNIKFYNKVNNDNIAKYYDMIDVLILPRKDYKVCNIVSPIKPLEAIALGKLVLASSVTGLNFIDDTRGVVFEKGNVIDLENKIKWITMNYNKLFNRIINARKYVTEHHDIATIRKKILDVYFK